MASLVFGRHSHVLVEHTMMASTTVDPNAFFDYVIALKKENIDLKLELKGVDEKLQGEVNCTMAATAVDPRAFLDYAIALKKENIDLKLQLCRCGLQLSCTMATTLKIVDSLSKADAVQYINVAKRGAYWSFFVSVVFYFLWRDYATRTARISFGSNILSDICAFSFLVGVLRWVWAFRLQTLSKHFSGVTIKTNNS
jgi:hypothetical protein